MRTKAARRCIVCQRYNLVGAAEMCGSCGEAYNRSLRRDARRFALKGK